MLVLGKTYFLYTDSYRKIRIETVSDNEIKCKLMKLNWMNRLWIRWTTRKGEKFSMKHGDKRRNLASYIHN